MKKFKYAEVGVYRPFVRSTDPAILTGIILEMNHRVPGCATRNEQYDLTNARVGFELHHLDGKGAEVTRWLLKSLCEIGFEPFQVVCSARGSVDDRICLRQEYE